MAAAFCAYCGTSLDHPSAGTETCKASCTKRIRRFVERVVERAKRTVEETDANRGLGVDGGLWENRTMLWDRSIDAAVWSVVAKPLACSEWSIVRIGEDTAADVLAVLVAHCGPGEFAAVWQGFVIDRAAVARQPRDEQAGGRIANTAEAAASSAVDSNIAKHLREHAQALRDATSS